MKKASFIAAGLLSMALISCGGLGSTANGNGSSTGNILGEILGAATNGQTIGNAIGSILGIDKPAEGDLYGTWKYSQPGVAFTSDNALAKAGGEVAATEARTKLTQVYGKVGLNKANTQLAIKDDKTFSAKISGKPISGTWQYDSSTQKLTLKTLLFSIPVYAKKTTTGMSFLMESKKLMTFLQTIASMSGNSGLQTIGDLSKNFDGVRLGFDMSR